MQEGQVPRLPQAKLRPPAALPTLAAATISSFFS
jgi:hypothetical protein